MPPSTAYPLVGSALSALVFAFFGSAWLSLGLAATHQLTRATALVVGAGLLLLVLLASWVLRQAKRLPAPAARPADAVQARRQWQVFGLVNAGQWGGIFLASWLLPRLGLAVYFTPVMAVLVGVHLFPLARLFRYASHYWTGGAFLLWVAGCLLLLPSSQWQADVALGAGVILWGSAGYGLWRASHQLWG
ncbi:hypothetical protein E4631_25165 [Hymenobacter sp. UV11]|uniref:hypothetical protein n=1 Tax=Hymenobacter sp. UV11 TaxID=1849735 RepID=UPI00105FBE14|nr:hypothetical protein [Hymenobacter sp. UV11]TDN37257.1 hypothetical protein A8B98_04785 [Hymenobacter sp. UV11]TFZ62449.1 hypothetical protein E4631_25165 [Hymenobacter sp. UV11]